ncbi:restriction endonuclease subunit S [Helicobacter pylori]|uniref:restriction endonuclease subunit S n=3 Tax=Helicobacter pylori TaxID=210 RepID=UPI00292796DB|nr:restriction endonuclease subunit S [Helicobacter pylori]MDU9716860.1 restriction endonuclease subunit S [Helicobacter pylori]
MDALTTPSNWQRVRLGDIAEIIGGGTPSTQITSFWNGSINWFTPTEIGITKYVYKSQRTITPLGLKKSSAKLLPIGTILLTSRASIGDCAILKVVATTNQGFQSLIPLEKINNEFLYYLILTLKNKLLELASGSTFLEVSPNKIKNLLIPLPPLNEQIAIANILSDVDHYLYSLDALILKKEGVKKALRIKMLNQILASNGVEFRELGDIILSLKTGLNPRSFFKLNTPNANNYYVTIRELEDYTIKFTHQTDRIDDNALSLCLKCSNLEKDDILFSGTGTIGKVSIIEKNPNNWAIKEGIYSIKPNKKIVFPRFLMFCLESSNIQNDIKNKSFGGIVKSIPMNDLQQIQIPLPPLNEQIAIANILSTLDHEIISLKNKKRQFDNIKKALNHDLMSAKIRVLKK